MTPTSLGLLLLWAAATGEVPRPDEADLFGSGSPATAEPASADPAQGAEPPPSASPTDRDAAALAGDAGRDAFATGEAVEDPLVIGGLYYQQLIAAGRRATPVDKAPLAMPFQFDGFFDARPNDRLRGFIDMRLVYDPTRDAFGNVTGGTSLGSLQTNSTATAPTGLGGAASAAPTNPQAVLNEAWIKFDIERTLFVTAGKQHVKWGASRYWNPTDLLNPQRRDPLLPYDLRLGATMLRLGLPFEASQSALYAVASYDNPTAASTLGQLSGAVRGETVLGEAEVGLDMIWRHGFSPVLGADLSAPAGPLDVYAEAALFLGPAPSSIELAGDPAAGGDLGSLVRRQAHPAGTLQVSGGANYSFAWLDNRQATVGAEYFYNQLGHDDPRVYPLLIFLNAYQPFYTGRHYASFYFTAEGADAEKHTRYTFSGLSNISDRSYIARADFTWRVLTYLTLGAYGDVHWGTVGGEFNFALDTRRVSAPLTFRGAAVPAIVVQPAYFDVGLSVRMSF